MLNRYPCTALTVFLFLLSSTLCYAQKPATPGSGAPQPTVVHVARGPIVPTNDNTVVPVVTLNLPAGNFLVQGKLIWVNTTSQTEQGCQCRLTTSPTNWDQGIVDLTWVRVGSSGAATVPFLAPVSTAASMTLTIHCQAAYGQAERAVLTATTVSEILVQ